MNAQEDILTLVDDAGNEFEFLLLDLVPVDGREYAVLHPMDPQTLGETASEEDVLVMRVDIAGSDDEDMTLSIIEDADEFKRVEQYLTQLDVSDEA